MGDQPIRVLFNVWADEENFNAQSLNAREIALRLDPARFRSTLFVQHPDPRMVGVPGIRLVQLPSRLRSIAMMRELMWGHYHVLVYPPIDLLDAPYRRLRRLRLGTSPGVVLPIEGTAEQLMAGPAAVLTWLREADCRVSISPFIADTVERAFGLGSSVIQLGVDRDRFAPMNRDGRGAPLTILTVASIQPRKRIEAVLDAAARIGPANAEFHVVGDPIGGAGYRDELESQVRQRGLPHVHFHGAVSQDAISEWMRRSDVFLLPSRLEGTPRVIFEAAATGLPCVVFADYHTPSVVDGVTGFQVSSDVELIQRVEQLVQDQGLRARLGVAASEHMESFGWDRVARAWERLLDSAAKGRC
jgi:glycosyltransferase involved in cell wall biosynthesis